MSFKHDEVREMFPEYLKGVLSSDMRKALEIHIRECPACRAELSMMSRLVSIDAPDPGNLFWATFPMRVEGLVSGAKEHRYSVKSLFIKFIPAAAALAVLLAVLFTGTGREGVYNLNRSISNPFNAAYRDFSDLTREEVHVLAETPAADAFYMEPEDILEGSYHREFASLSSGEIERLYEVLKTEQTKGG